ncbi:MAG: MFS transporter [Alphaproteobacteria bacterium]
MDRRWRILATLTLARTAMGFQFQVVTATGSDLAGALSLSNTALGLLVGLYLLPGVALAIPGGWLGQRFGDKQVVLAGLAMMAAGAALAVIGANWPALVAGRVLSGVGAVLLNVLMTKMVADWFAARDLPFAMGVLILSWPLGIALAMVTLPSVTILTGWQIPFLATGAVAILCLLLIWRVYRPAGSAHTAPGALRLSLPRTELVMCLLGGLVWSLYNIGFISLLSFGPGFLIAGGADVVAAQATVSTVGWLILPTLAAAGWVAAKLDRPDAILAGGLAITAGLIFLLPLGGGSLMLFAVIGLLFGLPGPVIMTLPVEAVAPERRGIGIGIFWTLYYLGMAVAGPLGGWLQDATGSPAAPIWLAGVAVALALVPLVIFRALQRRSIAHP